MSYEIKDASAYLVDIPLNQDIFPFSVSYGSLKGLKRVFLKLTAEDETGDRKIGWGEASPLYPYSNETPLSVFELLNFNYANVLKGQQIASHSNETISKSIESILDKTETYLSRERLNFTQTAIDYALYDLGGKIGEVPTYELLGDNPSFEGVNACWSTSSGDVEKALQSAEEFVRKGYAVKVKLDGNLEQDTETTARIIDSARSINPLVQVRADANAAYSPEGFGTYCRMIESMVDSKTLEDVRFYVEEPIDTRKYGMDCFIDVIRENSINIMADETLYTLEDGVQLIDMAKDAGVIDRMMFNIKVQKVGGLRNAMRLGKMAQEEGVEIMVGGMFPSSYAKLANCHYSIALGKVMASDGIHPSRDYVDMNNPVIKNIEDIEVMHEGKRDLSIFRDYTGIGGDVDERVIKGNSMKINFGDYYPDFEGFRI
ncbi:MAG: mandelate racemase/muconate lactonizing enzyme family protein [Nanobdellota archaeon]